MVSIESRTLAFQRTHYWTPKIHDGAEIRHLEIENRHDVETRCRIPISGTSGRILSHVIPEPTATLLGAATGRIQWHVIPEPRITLKDAATLWIHCHDSRATCHMPQLQGVRSPSAILKVVFCHILFIILFFYAVSALTSGGFRIASDTFVLRPIAPTIYRPTYLEVEINSGVR